MCEFIDELILWKDELLKICALPNNITTKLLIIISGLFRMKSLMRVSINETSNTLKKYAQVLFKIIY